MHLFATLQSAVEALTVEFHTSEDRMVMGKARFTNGRASMEVPQLFLFREQALQLMDWLENPAQPLHVEDLDGEMSLSLSWVTEEVRVDGTFRSQFPPCELRFEVTFYRDHIRVDRVPS